MERMICNAMACGLFGRKVKISKRTDCKAHQEMPILMMVIVIPKMLE